jgi:hypothetical protein
MCLKRRTFYQCHHRALLVDAAAAAASAADAHTVPCMVSAMKWLWGGLPYAHHDRMSEDNSRREAQFN